MSRALRVLITGGTGLLGKALLETAPAGFEVLATFHRNPPPVEWRGRFFPLDVTSEASVAHVVAAMHPDVVIHAASLGSVDQAEREPALVRRVNVEGTQAIGRSCARCNARLVFISSNAVFDGAHPPYAEDSPVRAVNRYGALKIEAEAWVRASGLPHVIIRPILMYGWPFPGGRENVVTRWLAHWEAGQGTEVAQDIYSMPLFADNCAEAIWAAVREERRGTYHVAGANRVSLAAFAKETACVFGHDERLVIPVASAQLSGFAPRPSDTSFVTTKMERELGVRPIGIAEGLAILVKTRALAHQHGP